MALNNEYMLARASLIFLFCLPMFGLAMGCGSSEQVFAGELAAPVVYGSDDRVEVSTIPMPTCDASPRSRSWR